MKDSTKNRILITAQAVGALVGSSLALSFVGALLGHLMFSAATNATPYVVGGGVTAAFVALVMLPAIVLYIRERWNDRV